MNKNHFSTHPLPTNDGDEFLDQEDHLGGVYSRHRMDHLQVVTSLFLKQKIQHK